MFVYTCETISTITMLKISIIPKSFLVPLYNPLSLIPRQPLVCFLSLQISLHFLQFYKMELFSMYSFFVCLLSHLSDYMNCTYFLQVCGTSFHSCKMSLEEQKFLILIKPNFINSFLLQTVILILYLKNLSLKYTKLFCYFFVQEFSKFTFRSLFHFELVFLYGVRYG